MSSSSLSLIGRSPFASSSLESDSESESLLDSDDDDDDESDPVVVVVAFVVELSCDRRRAELSIGCTAAGTVFVATSGCASVGAGGSSTIVTSSLHRSSSTFVLGAGDDSADGSDFFCDSPASIVRRFAAECSSAVTIDNLRFKALMLLSEKLTKKK